MTASLSEVTSDAWDELLAKVQPEQQATPRKPRAEGAILRSRIQRLRRQINELRGEALRLARPLPHAESFHASRKQIRLLIGSNQSAKTFHQLLEAARAVTGQDPYKKYPLKDGRAVFVGYDGDHLADPLYRKLFHGGEFKLVKDEQTGQWRAVRPDLKDPQRIDPYDWSVRERWKDAPPLIPPRMVADIAWERKDKEIPRIVTLINGWRILWRSSNSRPPRGRQVHLVVLDEDLQNAHAWVNELIPRLLKHEARLIWAATAQEGGPELYELCEKAKANSPHVATFKLLIEDNPFISDEQRQFFLETLTSEEEIAVRYYGGDALVGRKIYREYDPNGVHGCEPFPIPTGTWCRYVSVDPGRKHCGTLFGAVDPEEKHRYVYDGFDLQHADAHRWAEQVAARQGDMRFEAFVMDQQMGRQHPPGSGRNVAEQYWAALVERGIRPRREGPMAGFFPGSNDIAAREEALLGWMMVRGTGPFRGTPLLQVVRGAVPFLDRQINLAQSDHRDEKRLKLQEDLVQALEYMAAFNPGYYRPVSVHDEQAVRESVIANLQRKRRRRQARTQAAEPSQEFGSALEVG